MGTLFVYILKASVCLALFYLFYRLLLSRETFHRFNRIALLGILLLSLLIPLIEVTVKEHSDVQQTMLTLEQLLMMADAASVTDTVSVTDATSTEKIIPSWIQWGLLVYLGGILFFACRHLYSLTRLLLLVRSGRREKLEHGIFLIIHQKEIAPFSWVKYIVISQKDLEENGREILIHEKAHIRNRHSIDLLVADVCIFFQWFNPASWLLKQELQNIHEYEADETVIKEGVNAKEYQLLLIKKAVGTRLYSMANSFNHSSLKKRITMMLKEKSSPWARLKYFYVLPLAAIAVTAFARPEVSDKVEEISAVKVNDLAAIIETKVQETVELPKGTTYLPVDYSSRITSSNNSKTGDVNHRISVDMNILDEKGKPVDKESAIVIPFSTNVGALSGTGGQVKLTGIPAGNVLRVFYGGAAGKGIFVAAQPKLTVTLSSNRKPGKTVSKQPGIVRDTMQVKKTVPEFPGGMEACLKYLQENLKYPPLAKKAGIQGSVVVQFTIKKDGTVASPEVVNSVNAELDKEAIRLINSMPKWNASTLNGKAVAMKYTLPIIFSQGSDATHGVVVYRSRAGSNAADPLYIVDGIETSKKLFSALDSNQIESMTILKDAAAKKLYGERAKDGVILITLKNNKESQEAKKHLTGKVSAVNYSGEFELMESSKKSGDEVTISGQVKDKDGKGVSGATVIVKGSTTGTIADKEGRYTIKAPQKSALVVSYVDMKTKEVEVSEGPFTVTLEYD